MNIKATNVRVFFNGKEFKLDPSSEVKININKPSNKNYRRVIMGKIIK